MRIREWRPSKWVKKHKSNLNKLFFSLFRIRETKVKLIIHLGWRIKTIKETLLYRISYLQTTFRYILILAIGIAMVKCLNVVTNPDEIRMLFQLLEIYLLVDIAKKQ